MQHLDVVLLQHFALSIEDHDWALDIRLSGDWMLLKSSTTFKGELYLTFRNI